MDELVEEGFIEKENDFFILVVIEKFYIIESDGDDVILGKEVNEVLLEDKELVYKEFDELENDSDFEEGK